ncbi:MAG: nuclear transport factor 2 family protein [Verrucomicrobia bacterium]|nr:nuclear transport factor 2 family protein [Verrucomicrobiota bacterium]
MRSLRSVCLLFAASFLAVFTKADEPPVAQLVAQTERTFSARSAEIGIRDSFLEYFTDDAIRFGPEPHLARPDLQRETSSNKVRLTWQPKIVRVASTGQLAVSTGPYLLQTGSNKSSGYYLSIWKRQDDGAWKVAADIGVSGPSMTRLADDFQSYPDPPDQGAAADLLAYEREQFSPDLDLDHIYRSIASPETVFERDNQPLQTGQPEYAVFLYAQRTKRTKLSQAGGSTSGNLGFTYGTQSDETSNVGYLRVWVLRNSRWSLMFDVVSR